MTSASPAVSVPSSAPISFSSSTQTFTPPSETSTMTTLPPGFGAQSVSGFYSTAFTWITTTRSDGSSTVLPIIGGLALWEVPTILNVRFQLKLPGFHIPAFSFPCIRILFASIGDCDNPPTDDESSEPSSSPSPSSSPPPSSSSSSQSSDSCTQSETTSDCQVTCSLSLMADGGTITDCYTTVCSMTRAPCSITATTSTTFISTTSVLQCPLDYSNDESSSPPNGPDRVDTDGTTTTATSSTIRSVTELGLSPSQCVLQMDSARTSITWPWTPGGGLVLRNDLDAAGVTTFTEAAETNYMQGTRTSLLRWLSSTTNAVNCGPSIVSISGLEYQAALDAAPDDTREEKNGNIRPSLVLTMYSKRIGFLCFSGVSSTQMPRHCPVYLVNFMLSDKLTASTFTTSFLGSIGRETQWASFSMLCLAATPTS